MGDEYIKREDALDIVAHNNVNGEITLNRYDKIIDGIYEIPSADVVPVVRCKDCKRSDWYTGANGKHLFFCLEHGSSGHSGDDYCSYGEREEDE